MGRFPLGNRPVPPWAWVFIGSILIQFAWITAVPPFRGIDEFDQAYRADAVAHGAWGASHEVPERGRGNLEVVRRSIVESAGPVCAQYRYTGHDNCFPASEVDQDRVKVASGAARYHPAFYLVVGLPARIADGASALYIMRATAALLCSAMLALAVHLLSLWSSTRWPMLALLVAATPIVMYSTALPAPNGLEILAGAATWAGLLGLAVGRESPDMQRRLLIPTTVAAVVLATLRQLGPLWLLLILLHCIALAGWPRVKSLVSRHGARLWTCLGSVGSAVLLSVLWVLLTDALASVEPAPTRAGVGDAFRQPLLWVLQAIAAFPTRNERAPTVVYAVYVLIVLAAVVVCLRSSRFRLVFLSGVAISFFVPLMLTLATLETNALAWQGRYGMPFSVGLVMLCGVALGEANPIGRLVGPALASLWLALITAHTVSVLSLFEGERHSAFGLVSPEWPIVPAWCIAAATIVGLGLWAYASVAPGRGELPSAGSPKMTPAASMRPR